MCSRQLYNTIHAHSSTELARYKYVSACLYTITAAHSGMYTLTVGHSYLNCQYMCYYRVGTVHWYTTYTVCHC